MRIPARYNGPATSGHGGYTAGLVAAELAAGPVAVSLRAPVPLDTDLTVCHEGDGVSVHHGETLIATAAPSEAPAPPPAPVTPAEAAAAARDPAELTDHPDVTCFGCGPQRRDGLRLHAGPLGDGRYAAAWTPAGTGTVDEVMVWTALDCPSAEPVANPHGGPPVVLARFTVVCDRPVAAGQPTALVAEAISVDGRKRRSVVGLFDADGERLAHGEALWIALREA